LGGWFQSYEDFRLKRFSPTAAWYFLFIVYHFCLCGAKNDTQG